MYRYEFLFYHEPLTERSSRLLRQVEQVIDAKRLEEEITFLKKNLKMKRKWAALEQDITPDSPAGTANSRFLRYLSMRLE